MKLQYDYSLKSMHFIGDFPQEKLSIAKATHQLHPEPGLQQKNDSGH